MKLRQPLVVLLALSLLAALSCGGAGRSEPPVTAPKAPATGLDLAARPPFDPDVVTGKLDNGLTYYIRHNERPKQRAELWLVLNAGSLQEDDDQQGLAHFVEHMAFNGTEHFAKQELVDYLEGIGMRFGPDLNAYTSFDETVYLLTVPTDDEEILSKAFLILQDWAQGIAFEGEEIDKERGVVMEEWRRRRGASARMQDEQFPILYRGSRYAERIPIGKPEVLEHAPYDTLRRFYGDWYRPDLMALIAVGDFDVERIEAVVREHFSGLENPEQPRDRVEAPVPGHDETLISVVTDPEASWNSVSVYYKFDKQPLETVGDFRRSLVEALYNSMVNARLNELRQQPDPPFLSAYSSSGGFARTRDAYYQSARVEEGGIERGLEALLVEIERVEQHGLTRSELDRSKKEFMRYMERAYAERDKRRSSNLAREMRSHFLDGEPMPGIEYELELLRRLLPTIELDELNHLAQEWIGRGDRVILAQAPDKPESPPPGEAALLAIFNDVGGRELEAYVDQVRDEPLVAELPEPGEIVERKTIDEIGVTEWRLDNGIRVVLKPTDFKNDEIVLYGASPGGTSLVTDEQYTSARFATSIASAGGVGNFDRVELEKALAGKVAGASVSISEREETARGSASPEDVETMFQLLYLRLTAPRKDPEAFSAWLERYRASIENRRVRPETEFYDKLSEVVSQGHFRRRPTTSEVLDEIDLDVALDVYRQRFLHLHDFVFVIVGNFEPQELEPHVKTYLGGLTLTTEAEMWRDVGVEPPPGVVEFEVRRGLEPKSRVEIRFSGDAEWSREASHSISSMAQVLKIRLREVLREDMGGTYSVRSSGWLSRRPRQRYGFSVSFECAPENVDPMVAAVFEEIESLKSSPPEQEYVDKVRESQRRKRETDVRENSFWRSRLVSAYRYGDDPRQVLDYDRFVESVTPENVQAAARRYLNMERYVKGVLYPEEGAASE
ncbi:MAG: insulinase family protein [bacterium]|nr:insulinase family protein [bacterium]